MALRRASRGEIWFLQLPTDPPEKGRRPIVVVSSEARNIRDAADTILVIPLSTSIHQADSPTHLLLLAGETGLPADSIARARHHDSAKDAAGASPSWSANRE
jgi:mRNA interferase MazF